MKDDEDDNKNQDNPRDATVVRPLGRYYRHEMIDWAWTGLFKTSFVTIHVSIVHKTSLYWDSL